MKHPFTFVLAAFAAMLSPISGFAQGYKNEKVAYFDADGRPTKANKAVELDQIIQFGDSLWEFNIYLANQRRAVSFRAKDSAANLLNGRYISYSMFGVADTIGNYVNGKRDGPWTAFAMNGKASKAMLYKNGELLWVKDSVEPDGKPHPDPNEAEFNGGTVGWLRFLNKNLRYPDDAVVKNIQGTVICSFLVDLTGHIPESSIYLNQSVSYSVDRETIRVILIGQPWKPATVDGRPVSAYKKQPIVFKQEHDYYR